MAWRERGGVDAAHHSRLPCDDLNQLDLGIWIAAAVACPRGGPKQAALTNDTATATNVKCAPQPSHVEGLRERLESRPILNLTGIQTRRNYHLF